MTTKEVTTPDMPSTSMGSVWLTLVAPAGMTLVRYCASWSSATGCGVDLAPMRPPSGRGKEHEDGAAPAERGDGTLICCLILPPHGNVGAEARFRRTAAAPPSELEAAEVLVLGVTVTVGEPHAREQQGRGARAPP